MSLLSFDLMETELMYEIQYFDEKKDGDITHEYIYRDLEHEGQYMLHFVPGKVNENMIKMSHYLFFECDEGVYYMDEFEMKAIAKNSESKAKRCPMNCSFINYELDKKIEMWRC
ncbi:hypothetical protein [uncultured Clostridium sp.]|uniref:hypothetical protein n=1 Tax=uncultured Clostridium sp. TaxID=59620 RepID=UPI0025ECC783|nr:hypothetical protein [uncultured Clostridium sp.]